MTLRRALPRILAVACLALAAAAAMSSPGPVRIGEFEPLSIRTPFPYPVSFGSDAREWTVAYPGATYIRVHFSRFDLAPGDSLELLDGLGRTVAKYEGRGIHGTGEFWAHTVGGDTAMLRLQATAGGDSGFEIDGYGRGTASIGLEPGLEDPGAEVVPESVCGTQDWRDAKCYSGSSQYDNARASVKAIIGCCSSCTAFKVSDAGQFLTNNHCTATDADVKSTQLLMMYEATSCGSGSTANGGSVMGSSLLATDFTLDYSLMSTSGDATSIPCLTLSPTQVANGTRIYIAGHPNGGSKKLSIESDRNAGGVCLVDDNSLTGNAPGTDVGYYCDTIGGSSGSPVLDYATHAVVALHHFGGCLNSGGRSDLIVNQIGGLIGTCTPGGGGGGGGGGEPPTCAPKGATCTLAADCCSGKCAGSRGKKTCK